MCRSFFALIVVFFFILPLSPAVRYTSIRLCNYYDGKGSDDGDDKHDHDERNSLKIQFNLRGSPISLLNTIDCVIYQFEHSTFIFKIGIVLILSHKRYSSQWPLKRGDFIRGQVCVIWSRCKICCFRNQRCARSQKHT